MLSKDKSTDLVTSICAIAPVVRRAAVQACCTTPRHIKTQLYAPYHHNNSSKPGSSETIKPHSPILLHCRREPENSRAHAASLVLHACLQVLQGYTHLGHVVAAITEFYTSAVQLMATGGRRGSHPVPSQRSAHQSF
jgi:hypothetical protein